MKVPNSRLNFASLRPYAKQIVIGASVALLLLAAVTPALYFYRRYQQVQQQLSNSNEAAAAELQSVTEAVGELVHVPPDEEPTLATVTNKDQLQNQPFFVQSENGDKVLIYTQAKKVYLYRPSTGKLVDMTTLNPVAEESLAQPAFQEEIKVLLRNGTTAAGLTRTIEPRIKAALPNLSIVKRENASKSDYEQTLVVVFNPELQEQGTVVANSLQASVSALPEGESQPKNVDILIIIGRDKLES